MFNKDKKQDNLENKEIQNDNKEVQNDDEIKKEDSFQDEEFSVWNIFEDFENDELLEQEIDQSEVEIKKDAFYYMDLVSNFLKIVNIILIIVIIIAFSYIKIQDSDISSEVLNPVCPLLLWNNISYEDLPSIDNNSVFNTCMSISLAEKTISESIKEKSKYIYSRLLKIATDYYTMKDFINSKEVIFLLNASENKKDPLDLLVKFDKAKNDFLVSDKLRIQCHKVVVSDSELEAECNAYSSLRDTSIPWYNWEKDQSHLKWGTSISLASSFLNFLEKQGDFVLLDKQKVFRIQEVTWEWGYSYTTPFKVLLSKRDLKLK